MAIRIVRNSNGNCITFVGSSRPAYWNACLSGQVNDSDSTRVDVINDIRTTDPDDPIYEFYAVPYTEFQDADGNSFASATECAAYITDEANVVGGVTRLDAQDFVDFARDDTNTTILTSLGDSFGVNAIDAKAESDGTITIEEHATSGINLYQGLRHTNVTIGGQAPTSSMTLNSVVNALNSLFRVSPVGAGGDDPFVSHSYTDTTPTVTAFGDVTITTGTATKGTNTGSQLNDGFFTSGTSGIHYVNAAGDYFEFDNTGESFGRKFIIGLLEASKFVDAATTFESITTSGAVLDLGVRLAPSAAYENSDYGVVIENGFFQGPKNSNQFRAGIRDDERLFISHYNESTGEWQDIVRSAFPVDIDNEEYMLVCLINRETSTFNTNSIVCKQITSGFSLSYRYIESPDGSFHYPLFASEAEANTLDTINGGSGTSTSNIYVDEPTNSTWYMPDTGSTTGGSSAPSNTESVTYTEIATESDDLYIPTALNPSDYTFTENQAVNISLTTPGVTTTVTGLPQSLGWNSSSGYVTGDTPFVSSTTTYSVTIVQTNAFGSRTETFDVTVTDNTSLGTLSGFSSLDGNFVQPNRIVLDEQSVLQYDTVLSPGEQISYFYTGSTEYPPVMGILSTTGDARYADYDASTDTLGSGSYDFVTNSYWDLRWLTGASWIGGNSAHGALLGWDDNTTKQDSSNSNFGVVFEVEYSSVDNYIRFYKDGVLRMTSASTYTGDQTITMMGVDNTGGSLTDYYIPASLAITTIGAGPLDTPSGFEAVSLGAMETTTLLGDQDFSSGHAVYLTDTLEQGKRYIFPQTWVETNLLPYVTELDEDIWIGVPDATAASGWPGSGMSSGDWDVAIKWEGRADTSHRSKLQTNGTAQDTQTVNSETDSYYDYAIEYDGNDVHLIACNIGDINTEPGVTNGGGFSRTTTLSSYTAHTDPLPIAFGVENGAQINLSTTSLQKIDIPYGSTDIRVSESSETAALFDVGNGPVDAGSITLNAGYTYRFWLNNASIESGDTLTFETLDGTAYTTGVTTVGSHGDYLYYVQFAVPGDVPPIRPVWNSTDQTAFVISGSTYVAGVTGITQEGPAANQTGTNLFDAGDHGWLSIDEQLSAGERLVMSGSFLSDLVGAMPDNSFWSIGVKDGSWTSTSDANLGFEGGIRFSIYRATSTFIQLYTYKGESPTASSTTLYATTSNISTYNAFFEVTNTGNNVRTGVALTSTNDATTDAYADWDTNSKMQSGNQGYGITSIDVMSQGIDIGGSSSMDADDIDWTALSEISIPSPAATLTTNWTRAIHVNAGSEYMRQEHNGSDGALYQATGAVSLPTAGTTTGRSWAMGFVFRYNSSSTADQTIIGHAEGATGTGDLQLLKIINSNSAYSGYLRFDVGKGGSTNVARIGTSALTSGAWYGVYMDFNGARFSAVDATSSNLAAAYRFKLVDLSTGAVSTLSQTWTTTGNATAGTASGYNVVGGRMGSEPSDTTWAGVVMTTLRSGQNLPTDTEISVMVRDPLQWEIDYKNGNPFRSPNSTGDNANNYDITAARRFATQIWLMGDGTSDAYALIRNQANSGDQNDSPLRMFSMVSNDIQTVTITGLT